MTVSARTVETNAADALAELLYMVGDGDNAAQRLADFEDSFSSRIRKVEAITDDFWSKLYPRPIVSVSFEDGSVLHLTVTQIKEPNQ